MAADIYIEKLGAAGHTLNHQLNSLRLETATVNQAAPKQWFCVSEEPARASARASTSQFESARASLSPESQRGPCETAASARCLYWRQARFTVVVSLRSASVLMLILITRLTSGTRPVPILNDRRRLPGLGLGFAYRDLRMARRGSVIAALKNRN